MSRPPTDSGAGVHASGNVAVLKKFAHVVLAYVGAWHASFVLVFLLRGDSIDSDLYFDYLHFLITPGFEIPTFIQFGAIVLTVIYFWVLRLSARLMEEPRRR